MTNHLSAIVLGSVIGFFILAVLVAFLVYYCLTRFRQHDDPDRQSLIGDARENTDYGTAETRRPPTEVIIEALAQITVSSVSPVVQANGKNSAHKEENGPAVKRENAGIDEVEAGRSQTDVKVVTSEQDTTTCEIPVVPRDASISALNHGLNNAERVEVTKVDKTVIEEIVVITGAGSNNETLPLQSNNVVDDDVEYTEGETEGDQDIVEETVPRATHIYETMTVQPLGAEQDDAKHLEEETKVDEDKNEDALPTLSQMHLNEAITVQSMGIIDINESMPVQQDSAKEGSADVEEEQAEIDEDVIEKTMTATNVVPVGETITAQLHKAHRYGIEHTDTEDEVDQNFIEEMLSSTKGMGIDESITVQPDNARQDGEEAGKAEIEINEYFIIETASTTSVMSTVETTNAHQSIVKYDEIELLEDETKCELVLGNNGHNEENEKLLSMSDNVQDVLSEPRLESETREIAFMGDEMDDNLIPRKDENNVQDKDFGFEMAHAQDNAYEIGRECGGASGMLITNVPNIHDDSAEYLINSETISETITEGLHDNYDQDEDRSIAEMVNAFNIAKETLKRQEVNGGGELGVSEIKLKFETVPSQNSDRTIVEDDAKESPDTDFETSVERILFEDTQKQLETPTGINVSKEQIKAREHTEGEIGLVEETIVPKKYTYVETIEKIEPVLSYNGTVNNGEVVEVVDLDDANIGLKNENVDADEPGLSYVKTELTSTDNEGLAFDASLLSNVEIPLYSENLEGGNCSQQETDVVAHQDNVQKADKIKKEAIKTNMCDNNNQGVDTTETDIPEAIDVNATDSNRYKHAGDGHDVDVNHKPDTNSSKPRSSSSRASSSSDNDYIEIKADEITDESGDEDDKGRSDSDVVDKIEHRVAIDTLEHSGVLENDGVESTLSDLSSKEKENESITLYISYKEEVGKYRANEQHHSEIDTKNDTTNLESPHEEDDDYNSACRYTHAALSELSFQSLTETENVSIEKKISTIHDTSVNTQGESCTGFTMDILSDIPYIHAYQHSEHDELEPGVNVNIFQDFNAEDYADTNDGLTTAKSDEDPQIETSFQETQKQLTSELTGGLMQDTIAENDTISTVDDTYKATYTWEVQKHAEPEPKGRTIRLISSASVNDIDYGLTFQNVSEDQTDAFESQVNFKDEQVGKMMEDVATPITSNIDDASS